MDRPQAGRHARGRAVVLTDLCASCGVCVGACPSATPFRSGERLATGIDMPQQPIDGLRQALERALAEPYSTATRIVVFGCDCGVRVETVTMPGVIPLTLGCAAMLPPSFVEYAIRNGADGVVVSVCREGECAWRLGARWTIDRLVRVRAPRLRANVPARRLGVIEAGIGEEQMLLREVDRMQTVLSLLPRMHPSKSPRDSGRRRVGEVTR
jgi:coenzyme F420-reducing hydrogenase delta subunit